MKKFTENYISPLQTSIPRGGGNPCLGKKVRIAVIDSGVTKEDPEIVAANVTQRIRGYRNFTSANRNDYKDEIGHGTKIARLLLTVAPEAELYIAKVAVQEKIPDNQLYHIAEV
jgi:subtilisin family serine protease